MLFLSLADVGGSPAGASCRLQEKSIAREDAISLEKAAQALEDAVNQQQDQQ